MQPNNIIDTLSRIKEKTDETVSFVKGKFNHDHGKNFWIPLFFRPLFNFQQIADAKNGAGKVASFLSTPLSPAISALGISWYANKVGDAATFTLDLSILQVMLGKVGLITITTLAGYLVSVYFNYKRMTTLFDPKFHIEAYKFFKKEEWEIFSNFMGTDFTFKRLYDYYHEILNVQKENKAELGRIQEIIQTQQEMHENELGRLLLSQQEDYERQVEEIEKDLEDSVAVLNDYKHIVDNQTLLLKWAINLIFRIHAADFNKYDLSMIARNFSVYRFHPDTKILECVAAGGVTKTPMEINISDDMYSDWAVVQALSGDDLLIQSDVRPGHHIASKRILLDSKTLVFNIHYDAQDSTMCDIIGNEELHRLIESVCLHLDSKNLFAKEAAKDAI